MSATNTATKSRAASGQKVKNMSEPLVDATNKTIDASKIKTKTDFIQFCKARRQIAGLTQAELAKATGYMSGEYIALIEADKRNWSPDSVPLLADALKLNRQELTKLFIRIMTPNVYSTFWGVSDLNLGAKPEKKKFTQISQESIDLINKIYSLDQKRRRTVVDMIDSLAG